MLRVFGWWSGPFNESFSFFFRIPTKLNVSLSKFPLIFKSRGLSIFKEGERFTSSNHGLQRSLEKLNLLHIGVQHNVVPKQFVTVRATHIVLFKRLRGLLLDAHQTFHYHIVYLWPHKNCVDSLFLKMRAQGRKAPLKASIIVLGVLLNEKLRCTYTVLNIVDIVFVYAIVCKMTELWLFTDNIVVVVHFTCKPYQSFPIQVNS